MNYKIAAFIALLAVTVASVCAAGAAAQQGTPLSDMGGGDEAADVPVDSWTGLQQAIDAYEEGQVIVVTQNLVCDNGLCISVKDGPVVIDLDGHVLDRDLGESGSDGSVISVYGSGDLTVRDSKGAGIITGGWSVRNGGGICVSAGASCSIEGVTVSGNIQNGNGGGIYAEGCLTVKDSVIEGNIAKGMGGAVYVQTSCYELVMGGMITATDNEASVGNGVYLQSGAVIDIRSPPDAGSRIRVSQETYPYVFTLGLSASGQDGVSTDIFVTDYGYAVGVLGGEALLAEGQGWQIEEGRFIDWKDRVNADYYSITGANWMSGVSGERLLNEINVPETHNSCTQDVSGYGATVKWRPEYYETQKLFARQLMEDGVRCFDLRLINWYYDESKDHFDDGHTLWIGHGKDYDSYHMALDERGNMISFDMLLNWVMQFLTDNPSEMITLDLAPEVDKDQHQADYQLVLERTRDYLQRYDSRINPSTGEKFLYSEDGTYGEPYTFVPKLRDCRGKIFITCGSGNVDILGGMVYKKFLDVHSVEGEQSVGPEKRVENIMKVYDEYCKGLLPADAVTHLDDLNKISINCTDKSIGTPMEVEAIVFKEIFDTKHLLDQRGIYYGFWRGDAITAWEANYLWRTNYSDHLQYRTVTVQSGIEGIPDQTFILLKGTDITIPGCIYPEGPSDHFSGWRADGKIYSEGDEFPVGSDVTFSAVWEFNVSFDANGHGTAPEDQTVEYGCQVIKPADPSAEGWIFGGWFKEAACRTPWDFDRDTVTGDTVLYAGWTAVSYTVIFDANGGTPATQEKTTGNDGRLSDLPSASREGYLLDGWYTQATGGVKISTSYVFTKDATVYAHWTEEPVPETYTVTFDANGGSCDTSTKETGTDGRLASLPDAVRDRYTFDGWYTQVTGGEMITTSYTFTDDTTVYAHWSEQPSSGGGIPVVAVVGAVIAMIAVAGVAVFMRIR